MDAQRTVQQLRIHLQIISNWQQELLLHSPETFSNMEPDEKTERRKKALYEKIGRLEIEMYFCKRASEKLGIQKSSKK